jgi:hypothetical protein
VCHTQASFTSGRRPQRIRGRLVIVVVAVLRVVIVTRLALPGGWSRLRYGCHGHGTVGKVPQDESAAAAAAGRRLSRDQAGRHVFQGQTMAAIQGPQVGGLAQTIGKTDKSLAVRDFQQGEAGAVAQSSRQGQQGLAFEQEQVLQLRQLTNGIREAFQADALEEVQFHQGLAGAQGGRQGLQGLGFPKNQAPQLGQIANPGGHIFECLALVQYQFLERRAQRVGGQVPEHAVLLTRGSAHNQAFEAGGDQKMKQYVNTMICVSREIEM